MSKPLLCLGFLLACVPSSHGLVAFRGAQDSQACTAEDLSHRVQVQNKLAGICEDMCKEVGAYPKCAQCPDFVEPDKTPGVMTWDELFEHMDNLVNWGQEELKAWHKTASALQTVKQASVNKQVETSCAAADAAHRAQFQNKLAGICEDMCKEVGAYPKCAQCPDFVEPDKTPGVMTWDELLEHMDNLVSWGQDELKVWRKTASALQTGKQEQSETACSAEDFSHRAQFQNKLAGICEDMCKEVGAYPKCAQCPDFVEPDKTPGVMTWDELLEHMDNLVSWGQDELKAWHKTASALQTVKHASVSKQVETSCAAADFAHRAQLQNKLAGICEDMCKEVGAYP
eukprot:CAMPEP_0177520862 /NCGR_PEP_ID=MMETSP0369-20130122/47878_1 /TAXON_ID=447022 ORGANISM="Scrippsiella hangoei-like, Strain SHHI-4" /NCGR_SAMPLE_ID=MMETSP0369 /ASSEMBLY_ACC=CAM_ASM_000364 /LENGTH=341 /DNA_ID=CAMNT_0019000251 /DNA_START=79 /DNA_END=1100 /DNA_ORIENTATION=-